MYFVFTEKEETDQCHRIISNPNLLLLRYYMFIYTFAMYTVNVSQKPSKKDPCKMFSFFLFVVVLVVVIIIILFFCDKFKNILLAFKNQEDDLIPYSSITVIS